MYNYYSTSVQNNTVYIYTKCIYTEECFQQCCSEFSVIGLSSPPVVVCNGTLSFEEL